MTTLTEALDAHIRHAILEAGGWIGFDRYMQLALYAPGLGYYANDLRKFGVMPESGRDFVTAPELSPVFGQVLAEQVREALDASGTDEVWEFGAGSGALAAQVLQALGDRVRRYTIMDVSTGLRARQRETLTRHADKIVWAQRLPERLRGVVLGNEVLDAMPVRLLHRIGGVWHERGVAMVEDALAWRDHVTELRPPIEVDGEHDYLTEIHPQAEGFMRALGACLQRGAAFFIDYGFPEAEYYHPQRAQGTLVCHRAHRVDAEPLLDVGLKDITAHVNFTGVAVAAQEAGLNVLGYTSQARCLLNNGILQKTELLAPAEQALALKLVLEHEMGELFKVLAVGPGEAWQPRGFAQGDRTHRL